MKPRLVIALVVSIALIVAAGCRHSGTAPSDAVDLSGTWSGTSTYINGPFTMVLRQVGTVVSGQYRDQLDVGAVSGTATGSSFVLDVNFGDTGIRFTGTIESRNRLTGEVFVPFLSGRRFPFEMVR